MPLTCNIDSKGKLARLITGIMTATVGVILIIRWALPGGGWVSWTVAVLALTAGAFQIFEARAGWCAMRAMGFKTPM